MSPPSQLDDRIPTLLERVDLLAEVERRAGPPSRVSAGTATFHCPNPDHPDAMPSFTVKGERWRCWSACNQGGDVIDLLVWLDRCPKAEAIDTLARRVGLERTEASEHRSPPAISPDDAERYLNRFLERRRWRRETAAEVGLRIVLDGQRRPRVRFPFRRAGEVVFWQDRLLAAGGPKWLSRSGTIPCPFEADRIVRAHEVGHAFVLEGPADVVGLINEKPDAAVVGIPGAGVLKPSWSRAFAGLEGLWVIADNDPAGEKLRDAVERVLGPVVSAVYQVRVPEEFCDLDDWRRHLGGEAFIEGLLAAVDLAAEGRER